MSQLVSAKRTLPVGAATVAALALAAFCPTTLPALAVPTPAAQAATPPPASARSGYFAQTACSEGAEGVVSEDWFSYPALSYPQMSGHLNTCGEPGGAMTLRDEGARDSEPDSGPIFVYQAPVGSLIAGGTANIAMTSPGGEAAFAVEQQKTGREVLASCNETCTGVHNTTVTIPDTEWWLMNAKAVCKAPLGQSKCATTGVNAELSISTATILLHSTATPEATGVTGSLTESPVSGTANIEFTAHEKEGPGVYRVTAAIDGANVWAATPNTEYGKCVAHGTYENALNFHNANPCPQETPVRIELPTASIADGPHLVEVAVEDAAGNKSVVLDKTVTITNHPGTSSPTAPIAPPPPTVFSAPASRGPANGTPASEQATLTAAWLTSRGKPSTAAHLAGAYGHAQKVSGRLTDPAGKPIVGAAIEVSETPTSLGAATASVTVARTAPDGTYTVKLPANLTAGSVTFTYRSHLGDPLPAAKAVLTVSMPARISLASSSPITTIGRTVTFSGNVAGPIPPGGKQVVLEARAVGGVWVQFNTPDTDTHGHFHAKHRFVYPGPARYEFRAICKREADFPFSEGKSKIVRIREH